MAYFLSEQKLIQEAQVQKINSDKAVFKLIIQDANSVNKNRRYYPKDVLVDAINEASERIEKRSFIGELDHPLPTGQMRFDEIRQTSVQLKNSSHVMTEYEWDGDLLWGTFETLSNDVGKDKLLGLIKDRLGIGVSMRGMAELSPQKDYNLVKSPLYIVCYDIVSNPSHYKSVIDANKVTFESVVKLNKETISESNNGKIICTEGGNCYLWSYFDRLVEQKLIEFYDRWI